MMQENGSNLVVKTICEMDIRVKSYREKKKICFACNPPLSLIWLATWAEGEPAHAALSEGAGSSWASLYCGAIDTHTHTTSPPLRRARQYCFGGRSVTTYELPAASN
jgi:hypothetical protein